MIDINIKDNLQIALDFEWYEFSQHDGVFY